MNRKMGERGQPRRRPNTSTPTLQAVMRTYLPEGANNDDFNISGYHLTPEGSAAASSGYGTDYPDSACLQGSHTLYDSTSMSASALSYDSSNMHGNITQYDHNTNPYSSGDFQDSAALYGGTFQQFPPDVDSQTYSPYDYNDISYPESQQLHDGPSWGSSLATPLSADLGPGCSEQQRSMRTKKKTPSAERALQYREKKKKEEQDLRKREVVLMQDLAYLEGEKIRLSSNISRMNALCHQLNH